MAIWLYTIRTAFLAQYTLAWTPECCLNLISYQILRVWSIPSSIIIINDFFSFLYPILFYFWIHFLNLPKMKGLLGQNINKSKHNYKITAIDYVISMCLPCPVAAFPCVFLPSNRETPCRHSWKQRSFTPVVSSNSIRIPFFFICLNMASCKKNKTKNLLRHICVSWGAQPVGLSGVPGLSLASRSRSFPSWTGYRCKICFKILHTEKNNSLGVCGW